MLRPSYTELMETLNSSSNVDNKVTSRYTIVLAVAKRARQLIDGADPLTYAPTDRAVSTAVKEMSEGMINIHFSEEAEFTMISGGLAYNDYEGSYVDEPYQSKKTIDYAIVKGDGDEDLIDYEIDEERNKDFDEEQEDMDYDNMDDYESTEDDYEKAELDTEQEDDYKDRDMNLDDDADKEDDFDIDQ